MGHENGGWMNADQREAQEGGADIADRDGEGDAWLSAEEDRLKFDRAIQRLDADVAAHEAALTVRNKAEEPVEVRVVAAESHEGERFGGRLLAWLANDWLDIPAVYGAGLRDIAAAIDQDAGVLRRQAFGAEWLRDAELIRLAKEMHARDLRQRVGEAVERLKHPVQQPHLRDTPEDEPWPVKDVLDAEPFLAELDRIFGERPELKRLAITEDAKFFEVPGRDGAKGLTVAVNPDGAIGLWPDDPEVNPGFSLTPEAARDLEMILRESLPGEFALAEGSSAATEDRADEPTGPWSWSEPQIIEALRDPQDAAEVDR